MGPYSIVKIKKGQDYTLDSGEVRKRLGGDVFGVVDAAGRVTSDKSTMDLYERKHAAESALRRLQTKSSGSTFDTSLQEFAKKYVAKVQQDKSLEAQRLNAKASQERDPTKRASLHAEAIAVMQGWGNIHNAPITELFRKAVEEAQKGGQRVSPDVLEQYGKTRSSFCESFSDVPANLNIYPHPAKLGTPGIQRPRLT